MRSDVESGKLYLDWNDCQIAAVALVQRMRRHGFQPTRILAVARGGLAPAALLSHLLDVREIGSVQVESYDAGHIRADAKVITGFGQVEHYNNPETLIVDDLWDTGNTHEHLRMLFSEAVTTTLFYKDRDDNSHRIVSFPGAALNKDRWVVFPWEECP